MVDYLSSKHTALESMPPLHTVGLQNPYLTLLNYLIKVTYKAKIMEKD